LVSAPAEPAAADPNQTTPRRRVYSVVGVPPEIQAYALAKYSRSNQGMLESIQELSQQRAEQFLNTFYFQYGHRSIADLAHLVFGLEQISILAAIDVVDEPVWDGQERSTRYQPFRRTGWHVPDEVRDTSAEAIPRPQQADRPASRAENRPSQVQPPPKCGLSEAA
jgi:thymidylate synthase ThyX